MPGQRIQPPSPSSPTHAIHRSSAACHMARSPGTHAYWPASGSSRFAQQAQHQTKRRRIDARGDQDHFDGLSVRGTTTRIHQREPHRKLLGQALPPVIKTIFARAMLLAERPDGNSTLMLLRDQQTPKLTPLFSVFDMSPVSATSAPCQVAKWCSLDAYDTTASPSHRLLCNNGQWRTHANKLDMAAAIRSTPQNSITVSIL